MSDLHRHPLSTCGVVTAGRFTFQLEGEPARVLRTGDDNASSTEPAEIVLLLPD